MSRRASLLTYLILPVLLLTVALALRAFFFCGFILCDDAEEFALTKLIADQGPTFEGHLQYRFAMWWFNVLFLRLLGSSETAFFLPTLLMSASLSVVAYLLLQAGAYSRRNSFLAGLFVASAPFEILLGALRANDLILAWFLALALLAFMGLSKRPIWQGLSLAILLWLAFYTKLWTVYVLPALASYYLFKVTRGKEWRGAVSFVVSSAVLHSATALLWKMKIGVFLPFLVSSSATYPVPPSELLRTFSYYPRLVFSGSEFDTTLFGYIPHLLLFLLLVKGFSEQAHRSVEQRPDGCGQYRQSSSLLGSSSFVSSVVLL